MSSVVELRENAEAGEPNWTLDDALLLIAEIERLEEESAERATNSYEFARKMAKCHDALERIRDQTGSDRDSSIDPIYVISSVNFIATEPLEEG